MIRLGFRQLQGKRNQLIRTKTSFQVKNSRIILLVLGLLLWGNTYAQLNVTANNNANALLSSIIGQGVTVSNVTLNCPNGASGTFTTGASGSNLGLSSGMMLTTGLASNAAGPNNIRWVNFNSGVTLSDPDITALEPLAIYDPCILEFDIIPTCGTLSINYVFGSDEYMFFVNAGFNDAFGFFITGPNPGGGNYTGLNIARTAGTNIPVTIDNINLFTNSIYYVDNDDGTCPGFPPFIPYPVTCTNPRYIQYNGFTIPLTASVAVVPCSTYRMKLAIADAGDGDLDSGVFFAASGVNGGGLFCQGATNLSLTFTTNLTCTAPNSGTATINPTGGNPPYSYIWSNGQTTQTATGLSAGTYDVTVSDNACSQANTNFSIVLVTTGPTLTFTQTNIPCTGGTTGAATVNITGGTPPLTIAWSNGVTTANNPNLTAGTYGVTVTDGIGCLGIGSVTITQAGNLSATATATASACSPAITGTVNVTAAGGTPPYTYAWSNGPTTQSQAGLAAGTYSVTVRDNVSCTIIASTTVTAPTTFTLAFASTPGNCTGPNTSSINLTTSGGLVPFTYAWSNGAATEDLNNVAAGNYTVTVTDANGCQVIGAAATTVPTPAVATAAATPVNCFGAANGTATATPTAGGAPYTYVWSNAGNTSQITGLTAGTYTVTVTGAGGCSAVASATVTGPAAALTESVIGTNPTCPQLNNGTVNSNPAGGTPPYTYAWSNGPATTQNQTGLVGGTYTVTVTDGAGCTVTASTVLVAPNTFTLALGSTNGNCTQPNSAAINLTVNGGLAPFVFAWSNGASTEDITNLIAGTYTVTVTDANNCVVIGAATLTVPTATTATATSTPASCFGANDGTATVTPTAGGPPYTYLWSNAATTNTITAVAGTYTVTVTGASGCTVAVSTTITQPTALTVTTSSTNPTCPSLNDGDATANPAGGTPPYAYLWSNGDITASTTGLVAGGYNVVITDANGCTATVSVALANPPAVNVAVTVTPEQCNTPNSGSATAVVNGGTAPFGGVWSNGFNGINPTNLAPGPYSVTITDGNNCTASASGTVIASTLPTVTLVPTNPGCNGASTGSLNATGSFATFTWSNGAVTNPAIGLVAGSYDVTVVDANGCTASASATLTDPTALTLSLTPTQLDCNIPNTGAVVAAGNGGTASLTYLWSNNATTASISSLAPGTYSVTVTDGNGCTISDAATLATPNRPTLALNVTPVDCSGPNSAAVDAVVTGGTMPIGYAWSNSATTPGIAGIGAGTYTVTITDGAGCTAVASVNVSAIPVLPTTVDTSDPTCFGATDGRIDVFGPFTNFNWSQTGLSMPATNLGAGTYSVTVSDNGGCSATRTFVLVEPSELTLAIAPTLIDCNDPNSGALAASVSGGVPAYAYQWSNAASIPALSGLGEGTYGCTITDANGCTVAATETLAPNPALTVSLGPDVVLCGGESVTFNLDTITAPMVWHEGSTINSFTATTAGTVTVTVDYPNGCPATDEVQVTVEESVTLYETNDTIICNTQSVEFVVGPRGFVYEWSDGSLGPEILIVDSGTYIVTATSNCNVVTDTINVIVERCNCEVFLPNAFSPNGDGVNDEFKAYAGCTRIQGFRLEVFDRWGALVFSSNDFNKGWNGLMSNQLCIVGVYVWQVSFVEAINGRNYEKSKKGSVVLLK